MRNISYKRIYQSQEYLSPLGTVRYRALFGGYSLSIDNTVFAMVAEGDLYLRVCEQSAPYRVNHPTSLLTLQKRGRPVLLNYYRVDDALWGDRKTLLHLSSFSLQAAQQEKVRRGGVKRLKDLPNITFHLEMLLMEVGIRTEEELRTLGAELAWLKIREKKRYLSVRLLYALEGAIAGMHEARLGVQRRQQLTDWFNKLPELSND
ncbi:TfoX/Sxy family DNA transformation protein [Superficieibacter sp. HKU1]|uniref:TfoX/Sxy family DNA transformation protein n=1 Tax=Superficieibacter sp. HKU1 TaxID=3031919 RepID=UPI0023E32F41|nr:TfoX/Sxy family DNA transformation protein [Superficieibacter sp. HKU1]WES70070.1 TfoX/Sxy family DNA transformation protein [Superficieibacter sp. HKU1]